MVYFLNSGHNRARAGGDNLRKNISDWKLCEDEIDRLILSTKSEAEVLNEAIMKGIKILSAGDLKVVCIF